MVSTHEDVKCGKVLAVAKHPTGRRMDYWLKVEYGDSKTALVHMLMSCGSLVAALAFQEMKWTTFSHVFTTDGPGVRPQCSICPAALHKVCVCVCVF